MKSLTQLNTFSAESVAYDDQGTGAQTLADRYQINGLIDTGESVMSNIEKICSAAGSWLSYDIHLGKWGVIINTTGTSVASFNDTNILGSITISGTGINELYNSVKVEFPHRELRDSADFVTIEIADVDRNANEEDNTLNLTYDIINEPVQAQLLGLIELKQSRIDLAISFQTDYSNINVKAGDLIDVTNARFGFTNKLFRVISSTEIQDDDGALKIEISALEYNADVYSTADLYRYTRTDENGIITIGSIGVPGTPQITKFQIDARPRIIIETTVPTGVVEGIEYWITEDTLVAEANRSYRLIGTRRPSGGNTFTSGVSVTLEYDAITTGDFIVKTRGINSLTTGPFSTPSGLIEFVAQQTTDAIGPNTAVIDPTGALLTAVAANFIMGQIADVITGNASTSSFVYKIFEVFEDITGVDLIGQASSGTLVVASPLEVQDDGTTLTNQVSLLNFAGTGFNIFNTGNQVTILMTGTDIQQISDLSDVDTTTIIPLEDDRLYWNGTNWVPDNLGNYYKSSPAYPNTTDACAIDGFIGVGSNPVPLERAISLTTCGSNQPFTIIPRDTGDIIYYSSDLFFNSKTGPTSGYYFATFTTTQSTATLAINYPADFISTNIKLAGLHQVTSKGKIGNFNSITVRYGYDFGSVSTNTNVSIRQYTINKGNFQTLYGLKQLAIKYTTGTNYTLNVSINNGCIYYRLPIQGGPSIYGTEPMPTTINGNFYNNNYYAGPGETLQFVGNYNSIQTILQGKLNWQYNESLIDYSGITIPPSNTQTTITYQLTIDGTTKTHTEILEYQDYNTLNPFDKTYVVS